MWITADVELPEELAAAHRDGRLVLFLGAGVSMGHPSNLPSFVGLTKRIALEAGRQASQDELEKPDLYLGDLSPDVDVHLRAREIIAESVARTELHSALVRLSSWPAPRIVTTNYDLHLSDAARGLEPVFPEYDAPALPLGDDFTGIVYLHGSIRQEPRNLVLTDRDFGRAYLTDAWAARFLQTMFRKFVVLFVGYSHNDVVMSYLARGLPRESVRFALTDSAEGGPWNRLGITPVGYPAADGHVALTRAVSVWAADAEMGVLDRRERVKSLVASSPPEDPAEKSFLERAIADASAVSFFCEFARNEPWVEWAMQQPTFRSLFTAVPHEPIPGSVELAWWFAEHFALDPERVGAAFQTVQALGGRLGPTLWSVIAQRLNTTNPKPAFTGDWIVLLLDNAPEHGTELLEYLLVSCTEASDRLAALMLFDHLSTPELTLRPRFGAASTEDIRPARRVDVELRLRGSTHWLDEVWETIFRPDLTQAADDLLPIVERHLRHAHRVLRALGRADARWDPVSYRRSAIEPHGQDSYRDSMDPLIDAARDTIVDQLNSRVETGSAVVDSWSRSDVPLLQRLAVHAWTEREDRLPDDKVAWLLERELLFAHYCRHEVFRLLQASAPAASSELAERLVRAITVDCPDDVVGAYERFNLLTWISTAGPDLEGVAGALGALQSQHPEFRPREHPDLGSWHVSSMVGNQLPMTVEQFHAEMSEDLSASLGELATKYRDATSPFEGPTWNDALDLVASTAAAFPEDGLRLLALVSMEDGPLGSEDVAAAVLSGMATVDLNPGLWNSLLELLFGHRLLSSLADAVSRLLVDGAERSPGGLTHEHLAIARRVAGRVWQFTDDEVGVDGDWLERAINSAAGRVAQFWIRTLSIERAAAADDWTELPADAAVPLEEMLGGNEARHGFARAVFASQLHFMFAIDEKWCRTNLLGVFDWSLDEDHAVQVWTGYLYHGRWNDRMLTAGLLEFYEATWQREDAFPDRLQDNLARHIGWIAIQSSLPAIHDHVLHRFHAQTSEHMRVRWAHELGDILQTVPRELAVEQWSKWIASYWTDRLHSIPRPLSPAESSAMARWCLAVADRFPEAVDLFLQTAGGIDRYGVDVHHVAESSTARDYPAATTAFVAHLLRNTEPPFWGCFELERIVTNIRQALPTAPLDELISEAVRVGCIAAPGWLDA